MAEELKPCASCGGESQMAEGFAVLEVWPHGTFYRAYCTVCQLRQLFYRTEAEAIAAWNRRAAPEPAAPTVVEPAGKLHQDGYFTWNRRAGKDYVLDKRLPCDFY